MLESLMWNSCLKRQGAFTLIELMVAVAVIGTLLALAAPSFTSMILQQRLKSINAQLVTDLQFARSEAANRNLPARIQFSTDASQSCYVIFFGNATGCNCTKPTATMCKRGSQAARLVSVPMSLSVIVDAGAQSPQEFAFDRSTGALIFTASDESLDPKAPFLIDTYIDGINKLRIVVNLSGRPSVCAPTGSNSRLPAC